MWRWHSCLDCGDPGNKRYTGVLAATGTRDMPVGISFFFFFFPSLWQFFLIEDWTWRWHSCLDHGAPHGARCAGMPATMDTWDKALLESFYSFWQLYSKGFPGWGLSLLLGTADAQKIPLVGVFLYCPAQQVLKWSPCLKYFSIAQCIRHSKSHPLLGLSLLVSCQRPLVGRVRLLWWLHPLCMTQWYHPTSMAAWISFKGISCCNLLPHVPSGCLPRINSNPCPGIAF